MNEWNQADRQSFFDALVMSVAADTKKRGKWYIIGLCVFGGIALLLLFAGEPVAVAVFGGFAAVMLVALLFHKQRTAKLKSGGGDLSFVKLHGARLPKDEIIKKLNQDYQDGQLLFGLNGGIKKGVRAFVFPQYFVFTQGSSINIIAEDKLYWAYTTVHKQNGVVVNYTISLFTEAQEVAMIIMLEEEAEEILRQLAINYSMWVGYDDKLKKLYNKNRGEFIRQMEEFKWYKKIPVG